MQTKTHSFIESVLNIAIGFGISFISQKVIFPIYNINIDTKTNLKIGACFTVVSIIRSYALRRLFNLISIKKHLQK